MSDETTELQGILDEFEHECFMLRVEASETRARDDVVRRSYERMRDEFAGRIAATLGSGTLTAEQVREVLLYHLPHREYYSVEQTDAWQAIADELNARAERTCRIVEYNDAPIPVCSECGAVQPDDYAVYYCWSCGAKVRDE